MAGSTSRGKGRGIEFLRAHVAHAGEACLIWPMHRLAHTGYGVLGFEGKNYYAHRLMCELVHGPKPSPKHQASHSCGKGHEGCVSPPHLSWKTTSENHMDRRRHGTHATSHYGNKGKLSAVQRDAIIALEGKMPILRIAEAFGISFQNVSHIHVAARKSRAA